MNLGTLKLSSRAFLSPLESVSDVGFRQLCFNNGAAMTWTEMARAKSITINNGATLDLLDLHDPGTTTGMQLLVKSGQELEKCLNHLAKLSQQDQYAHFKHIKAIDLNFGCPSPDIIRSGGGPALLKRKTKMKEILMVLGEWKRNDTSLNLGAVGCKIRLGLNQFEQDSKVYMHVVEAANEAKIDYITVHARHAGQRSSDKPTWGAIAEAKSLAIMPVIGNGDVTSLWDAQHMMSYTGCDGVMIARAAIRNPWMFSSLQHLQITAPQTINPENFQRLRQPMINNSTSSLTGSEFDPAVWPSAPQLQDALKNYLYWGTKYTAKKKYGDFHADNFARLHRAVTSGALATPMKTPRNTHIS